LSLLDSARRVIRMEAEAVHGLESTLGPWFERAIELLVSARGRVVTTGMGKAGLIARKVSATLSSTGTPSVFLHPAEAIHGDLGMVTQDDVIIAFSNSGQTEEIIRLLPSFKHIGAPMIAITSVADSDLAKHSDVALIIKIPREACPLNLAPTSSTTAMLVLGDTLALVLLETRGFGPEDYAIFHPGGSLGRRLLTKVADLMHAGDANPVVREDTPLRDAIVVMTSKKLAATSVANGEGRLVGFFSDGDLRRYLLKGTPNMEAPMRELMTRNPKVTSPDTMAVKALEVLREYKIIELPVVDHEHRPVGMIHLHDITRAGIA
jgi:arabinose-5-phosphate isomerase